MTAPTITEVFGDLSAVRLTDPSDEDTCWQVVGYEVGTPAFKQYRKMAVSFMSKGNKGAWAVKTICEESWCVNPDHMVLPQSPAGRMLYVKAHSYQDGDCRIWTGRLSDGYPVMPHRKEGRRTHSTERVQRFVYQQEHGTYDRTVGLVSMSCGNLECVSHKHVEWTMPVEDGICPEGHKLRPEARYYCEQCSRPTKTKVECDSGKHSFSVDYARHLAVFGCHYCRRDNATAYIRSRNSEALKAGKL